MSTTVVGSCMLAAMIVSQAALLPQGERTYTGAVKGGHIASLVPRALDVADDEVKVTDTLGDYTSSRLNLSPLPSSSVSSLLEKATMSCRRCTLEGNDAILNDILVCSDCGSTASVEAALPPRKYEEHSYKKMNFKRLDPAIFHNEFIKALPMCVKFDKLSVTDSMKPKDVTDKLWGAWVESFEKAMSPSDGECTEFKFKKLFRGEVWVASYGAPGAQLDLYMDENKPYWWLKIDPPSAVGKLRDTLERPVARMLLKKDAKDLLSGVWEICLPCDIDLDVTVAGVGDMVDSWEVRMGLKGRFIGTKRFSSLEVKVAEGDVAKLGEDISGTYDLLPKCGTACGSLHKRREGPLMFFFLESGRCTTPKNDSFVFTNNKRRLAYGEDRGVVASLHPSWRPTLKPKGKLPDTVSCAVNGTWMTTAASLTVIDDANATSFTVPSAPTKVAMRPKAWELVPKVVGCDIPLSKQSAEDKLWRKCDAAKNDGKWMEVNLQKSKSVFDKLAYVTSRLDVPEVVQTWNNMKTDSSKPYGLDCSRCAPAVPGVAWTIVTQNKRFSYQPREDVQEAGAYEQALKRRPAPFKLQLMKTGNVGKIQIGCNGYSLCQRARALLPKDSAALVAMSVLEGDAARKQWEFQWRICKHKEFSKAPELGKLELTSNKKDTAADQPPNFKKYPLRPEQLRSLKWMLAQEATKVPFFEEEVSEAILGHGMNWRAEGRVRRPVLVRGGIVADQVGYGKTAITLGLVDAAEEVNGSPPKFPEAVLKASIETKATLVIVPAHLMGQWPNVSRHARSSLLGKSGETSNTALVLNLNSPNTLCFRSSSRRKSTSSAVELRKSS